MQQQLVSCIQLQPAAWAQCSTVLLTVLHNICQQISPDVLPFVGLVDADGALVLQVAHPADGGTPPEALHLGPGSAGHRLSEAGVSHQLVCVLDGLLIVTWWVQEACKREHCCLQQTQKSALWVLTE